MGRVNKADILPRGVPCRWEGCKRKTRDITFYCPSHQRSSLHSNVEFYRDGSTVLSRLRLSTAARLRDESGSDHWIRDSYAAAAVVMDRRPEVRPHGAAWEITHYFDNDHDLDPRWPTLDGAQLPEGSHIQLDGLRLRRIGTSLLLDGESRDEAYQDAEIAAELAWRRTAELGGVTTGGGEQYDDAAEVLSLLQLISPLNRSVVYAERDDAVVVRLTSASGGARRVERIELITTRHLDGDRVRHTTEIIPDREVVLTHPSGVEAREPFLEAREAVDEVRPVADALQLMEHYAVRVESKLYLPLGWTERAE